MVRGACIAVCHSYNNNKNTFLWCFMSHWKYNWHPPFLLFGGRRWGVRVRTSEAYTKTEQNKNYTTFLKLEKNFDSSSYKQKNIKYIAVSGKLKFKHSVFYPTIRSLFYIWQFVFRNMNIWWNGTDTPHLAVPGSQRNICPELLYRILSKQQ